MKSFQLLTLTLLVLPCEALAQKQEGNGIMLPAEDYTLFCQYKLNYQPDSINPSFRTYEFMRLTIGKTVSLFESQGGYLADSLMAVTPANGDLQQFATNMMALPTSRFKFKIYKNRATHDIYSFEEVNGTLYRYSEPSHLYDWTITTERAQLLGYSCQKATTRFAGRTYTAWFTREIPVADGPYKFYGLPGLVVKISDARQQYIFELQSLVKPKQAKAIVLPIKSAKFTTKALVQKAKRDYISNLPNKIASISAAEDKQTVRNRVKRMNNSIELY